MSRTLSTDRMRLTPVAPAHAAALHALWTDGDVRRYLWDDALIPRERTDAVIVESERLFESSGLDTLFFELSHARQGCVASEHS